MAVRAITGIAALLLVCLMVKVVGDTYNCSKNQLVYCDSSPRLNISKSNDFYYLRIPMCSNDQCAASDVPEIVNGIEWVDCNNICEDCNKVLKAAGVDQDCGGNNRECELTLDQFLNSFCRNTTLATPTTCPSPLSSNSEKSKSSEIALGIPLALSMLPLAVVTTGWVCTCIITKKRQKFNRKDVNVNNVDDKDGERTFHNHMYAKTSATQPLTSSHTEVSEQENPSAAMYDAVNPPTQAMTENGPTYDVLKRGQADGTQACIIENQSH